MVYALKGHGEEDLPFNLRERLRHDNYELKELTLVAKEKLPEDLDLLLVLSPKRDLTAEEEEKIRDYLAAEGRALFILNWYAADLPNPNRPAELWPEAAAHGDCGGMPAAMREPGMVVAGDERARDFNPLVNGGCRWSFAGAGPEVLEVRRRSLEFTPLLTTSAKSWGKVNLNPATADKEPGDLEGPFTVAMAVVDKDWTEETGELESRLVVTANSGSRASVSHAGPREP